MLFDNDCYPWIPLVSLEQMEHTEYDVLIIGSGAGGGGGSLAAVRAVES